MSERFRIDLTTKFSIGDRVFAIREDERQSPEHICSNCGRPHSVYGGPLFVVMEARVVAVDLYEGRHNPPLPTEYTGPCVSYQLSSPAQGWSARETSCFETFDTARAEADRRNAEAVR